MSSLTIRWSGGELTVEPGTTVRIGREHDNEVRSNNVNVSRHHAELTWADGAWTVRDLDSAQGTWLDGNRITTHSLLGPTTLALGRPPGGETVELQLSAGSPGASDATAVVQPPTPAGPAPSAPTNVASPAGSVPPPPVGAPGTVILGGEQNRPGGQLRSGETAAATMVTGDALTIECGGSTRTLQPGEQAILGREADSTIVCSNPTVSRHHAEIAHDGQGWTIRDLGSSGGTFVDGRRITVERLVGSTPAMLGSPDAGERVVLVTRGERKVKRQGTSRGPLIAVGIVAVLALVAAGLAVWYTSASGPDDDELARATVRLSFATEYEGEADGGVATGSGTIIDAQRGLILTNAHVAAPQTPGQGLLDSSFDVERPDNPDRITIAIAPGLDKSAEPRFLGEVVAADGYLDLAVVKITRKLSGNEIEPGDLDGLTAVEVGSSAKVSTGDAISIFGYPSVADSAAATLTRGSVSGSLRDERVGENRSSFNIDADIRGGNSGGLAANDDGQLIGVPNLTRSNPRGDSINRMIPIDLARPLLAAAQGGKDYEPKIAAALDGEKIDGVRYFEGGIASGIDFDCDTDQPSAPRGDALGVIIDFSGFEEGSHQDLMIQLIDDGKLLGHYSTADEYPLKWPESGCAIIGVPLDGLSVDEVPLGTPALIGLGPNYELQDL